MSEATHKVAPEHTAVRVALWRALHVALDAKPHILEDEFGLKLIAPPENWRERPDMNPQGCRRVRAAIVARARFIEDLVAELGVSQYVILGAGLDTFAQRRPELASKMRVFEIDQPGPQTWKKQRLQEIGWKTPAWLRFVPVDFEAGQSWWEQVIAAGFDPKKPAVVASTGVSMYLTKEANEATLKQMAKLAPGSTFASTYMLPMELLEEEDQAGQAMTLKYAAAAGTPFISFYSPNDIVAAAKKVGFAKAVCLSPGDIRQRYLVGRSEGLQTASGEIFLVATT